MFAAWLRRKRLKRWYQETPHRARMDQVGTWLLRRGYLPVVVREYLYVWLHFAKSLDRRRLALPRSVHEPIVQNHLRRRFPNVSSSRFRGIRAAIRLLIEVDSNGHFPARMRQPKRATPRLFDELVPSYVGFLRRDRYAAEKTIRTRSVQLERFCRFLQTCRISEWKDVDARMARKFLGDLKGLKPLTVHGYAVTLRGFFRWAHLAGSLPFDLSGAIPTVRRYRLTGLPDVLLENQVEALLDGIDRSTRVGRRDYALVLLAARYGMRPSDIRQLRLDDIDWSGRRIALQQSKTGRPLVLPLLEDIAQALLAYLRAGRPATESRTIFVRHKAPFEPFSPDNNFSSVARKALQGAGLAQRQGRRGLNLFRHTLATRLLSVGQPLKTIGDILGHATLQSTLIYTKVDLAALRTVALPTAEVLE